MSNLTGCPRCDEHGPYLPGFFVDNADWRDLHRSLHDVGRVIEPRLVAVTAWLSQRLDKILRS